MDPSSNRSGGKDLTAVCLLIGEAFSLYGSNAKSARFSVDLNGSSAADETLPYLSSVVFVRKTPNEAVASSLMPLF